MTPLILLMLVTLAEAGFEIGVSNLALSESASFDAPTNAWTVSISHVPEHTVIYPQICHGTSLDDCPTTTSQMMMDCGTLRQELSAPNWVASNNMVFGSDNCPVIVDGANISVGHLLYVTHPPSLRIQNNVTALGMYASNSTDSSYTLIVRVVFVKVHDPSLLQIYQAHAKVNLQVVEPTGVTFTVQHECHARGLRAPPLSTLAMVFNRAGDRVCMWQCGLSHVRYPFNTPPPSASKLNHTNKMCVSLPDTFTAVGFDFNVYMRITAGGTPILDQIFYDDLNQLTQLMQSDAEAVFGECMAVLTVPNSVYGAATYSEILLAHVIHREIFSNYETINLLRPSRRLLADASSGGNAWFPVQGLLLIPRADINNVADLHEQTIDATANALQTFVFDESLQVHGIDQKIAVRRVHRSLARSLTDETDVDLTTYDIAVYIVFGSCILIIIAKTLLAKPRRRR